MVEPTIAEIRQAFADYTQSEGCSCCQDREAHAKHARRLGELLQIPRYADDSGLDIDQFRTNPALLGRK